VVNATVASTRPGGPIAAAWATLRHVGADGYLGLAARTLSATRGLAAAVTAVDGLALLVDPPGSSVVAFRSTDPDLDVFVVADELARHGWHVQPQMSFGGIGRTVHMTITAAVADQVPAFGAVLAAAVDAARSRGPAKVPFDGLDTLDPAVVTPALVADLAAGIGFDLAGSSHGDTSTINALLDAAPPRVRERLLLAVLDLMQRPRWQ
jgi:hypothetical protein